MKRCRISSLRALVVASAFIASEAAAYGSLEIGGASGFEWEGRSPMLVGGTVAAGVGAKSGALSGRVLLRLTVVVPPVNPDGNFLSAVGPELWLGWEPTGSAWSPVLGGSLGYVTGFACFVEFECTILSTPTIGLTAGMGRPLGEKRLFLTADVRATPEGLGFLTFQAGLQL